MSNITALFGLSRTEGAGSLRHLFGCRCGQSGLIIEEHRHCPLFIEWDTLIETSIRRRVMVNKFLPRFLCLNPNPFRMEKMRAVQGLACFSKQVWSWKHGMETELQSLLEATPESAHEKPCFQLTESVFSMFSKRAITVSFHCWSSLVSPRSGCCSSKYEKHRNRTGAVGVRAKKAGDIHPRPFGPASIPCSLFWLGTRSFVWNPLAPSF